MNLAKLLAALPSALSLLNPKVWLDKPRATALVAAILATTLQVLKAYDIDLPLDHETLLAIAGLVVTGVLYVRGHRDAMQSKPAADPAAAPPDASREDLLGGP